MSYNRPTYTDNVYCLIRPTKVPSTWADTLDANWFKLPCISTSGQILSMPRKTMLPMVDIAVIESSRTIAKFNFALRLTGTQVRESVFKDIEDSAITIPVEAYQYPFPSRDRQEVIAKHLGFTDLSDYQEHWSLGLPYTQASRKTLSAFQFFRNVATRPMPSLVKEEP